MLENQTPIIPTSFHLRVHGLLLLNKPTGITSNAALSRVKRILKTKKAGFAGTLDPMASGVLPIALGEATKCLPYIEDVDKEYEFTVRWGIETDTLDACGVETRKQKSETRKEEIKKILAHFTGEITQIPPIYSAIKINGQRAYDLARAGEAPEMKARQVTIYNLEQIFLPLEGGGAERSEAEGVKVVENETRISDFEIASHHIILDSKTFSPSEPLPPPPSCLRHATSPLQGEEESSFRTTCSKGTYIRSLARDIAYKLGTLGHLTALKRTRAGKFALADTISLENLMEMEYENATQWVMPIRRMLDDILAIRLEQGALRRLRQGLHCYPPVTAATLPPGTPILVLDGEAAFGIGVIKDDNHLWPRRIFNL